MLHLNPMRRVMPAAMINHEHHRYDKEKYADMLLDVAETILGPFGFSRHQLGGRARMRSYLEELRLERARQSLLELREIG